MPKKADANQPEIVAALRSVGASVQHLHTVGKGCPDILVGFRDRNVLLELKTEKGDLNEMEALWHQTWRGQVDTVRTPHEALVAIGALLPGLPKATQRGINDHAREECEAKRHIEDLAFITRA